MQGDDSAAQVVVAAVLEPGIQPRVFLAGVLSAVISERHQATLFVGERRGDALRQAPRELGGPGFLAQVRRLARIVREVEGLVDVAGAQARAERAG